MLNIERPRRNRQSLIIRDMVRQTRLDTSQLIFPLFVSELTKHKTEIGSMPGIYRYSPEALVSEIETCLEVGLRSFVLFPHLPEDKKDKTGSESIHENGLYLQTIRMLKTRFGSQICLMSDVALDPYSSDGHDGLVSADGQIVNDQTLVLLGQMAVAQARAGADIIGPSDMMDGRVGYIRNQLDLAGFEHVNMMSYCAKYASAFYGPFRDALESAPRSGDKKTYQMDPANAREALREARLDTAEGADILMVKPALAYLDVIRTLADTSDLPIAAYNVSGEYAMIKAAAQKGWLDNDKAMQECLLSISRAGASIILTYFAKEFAILQHKQRSL